MCSENHLHFDYVRLAWDAGFCFEEYNAKNAFDISTLGLVDVEKVTRDRDIATVERHIPTILQFHLDEELARILEPTFVKLFKLSQLSLQYLRFCNKYLDNTIVILKKDVAAGQDENSLLNQTVERLQSEKSNLSIKHKELKEAFQNINQTASFRCQDCPKVFASEEYLHAHWTRRHDAQPQTESEKLQMEIKELKERLNSTEKYIQSGEKEPNNDEVFEDKEAVLREKFEQLKEHIERELGALRDESFYRKIFEKWFEETFQKLQGEAAALPMKLFVEQGSGDCVQLKESSTQTNIAGEEQVVEFPARIGQAEPVDIEGILRSETEVRRQMLEKMFEQKIVGSLGKLETQMSSFGKKLDDLELKQLDTAAAKQIPVSPKEIKKHKILMYAKPEETTQNRRQPRLKPSTYIVAKPAADYADSFDEEEESEDENDPPKHFESMAEAITAEIRKMESREEPKSSRASQYQSRDETQIYESIDDARIPRGESVIPVARERKFKAAPKPVQRRIEPKPIRVGSLNPITDYDLMDTVDEAEVQKMESSDDTNRPRPRKFESRPEKLFPVIRKPIESRTVPKPPIRVGSLNLEADRDFGASFIGKPDKTYESSDDSIDFKVVKTVQKSAIPMKEVRKSVLRENVQRGKRKVPDEVVKVAPPEESDGSTDGNVDEARAPATKIAARSIVSVKSDSRERELFGELKEELETVLHLRLKEIGVASQWKGLPDRNFKHAMSVVDHQASLSSKTIPNYAKIRDGISKKIDNELKKKPKKLRSKKLRQSQNRGVNTADLQIEEKPVAATEITEAVTVFQNSDLSSSEAEKESPRKPVVESGSVVKKVVFDLDDDDDDEDDDSVQVVKAAREDLVGGSTSSVVSSVLDSKKEDNDGAKGDEEVRKSRKEQEESDWDISDIIA